MENNMKNKLKAALGGIKNGTVRFIKARGIYVVALSCVGAVALAAALTLKPEEQQNQPPKSSAEPHQAVHQDVGEHLDSYIRPTPTPGEQPSPTPIADFSPAPSTPKPAEKKKLSPPVRGEVIWGYAVNELIYSRTLDQWTTHTGVDIAAPKGTEVNAVFAGTVTDVFKDDALGVMVEVKGGNDLIAVYGSLKEEPPVKAGTRVNAGDVIGYVGDTAVSECGDKSHLHFELLKNEKYVNPEDHILFIKESK